MFSITTTQTATKSGAGRIVAKGHGKQRTVAVDHSKTQGEAQHAQAVGALLDTMLDDKQRAKMRHPSAAQRVRVLSLSDAGGKFRWSVNV